jgi:hypothetical protein
MYALVLEGLDYLGDLNGQALKSTPVLCVFAAVLLLIWPARTRKGHQLIPGVARDTIIRC